MTTTDVTETETIRFATGECSLGKILVGATPNGICAISFGEDEHALERELHRRFPQALPIAASGALQDVLAKVIQFIETPAAELDLPLDLHGTPFERRVWQALREIPPGRTASYAAIAERIGAAGEAYAVGEACAANPIAIAVPCHRVVRKNGALAGYRWGIRRKRALLAREAAGGKGLPLFGGTGQDTPVRLA